MFHVEHRHTELYNQQYTAAGLKSRFSKFFDKAKLFVL